MSSLDQFIAAHDFQRPDKEILVDLIRIYTDETLSLKNTKFGEPQDIDLVEKITTDEDTFVPVVVENNARFSEEEENGFFYKRLDLSILFPYPGVDITPPHWPFSTHQVLDQINAQLRVQFTESDIVNEWIYEGATTFLLKAHVLSLIWVGVAILRIGPYVEIPQGSRFTHDGKIRVTMDGKIRVIS